MEPANESLSYSPLDQEEIVEARAMPPAEKLWLGLDLFDRSCQFMRGGIRLQFPDADDARVEGILRERLNVLRRVENGS